MCIYLREENRREENEEASLIYLEIVKLLILYHVKIRIRNEEKRTPLEVAVANVSLRINNY